MCLFVFLFLQNNPFLGTYKNSNYTYVSVEPTNEPTEVIVASFATL